MSPQFKAQKSGSAIVAIQNKPRIPTHIMAHKIQESAKGSKQAELRMGKKKESPIEFIEVIVARGSLENRPRFFILNIFLLLFSRPIPSYSFLSWHLGNSYKSEKFSSREFRRQEATMHE